jgi:spore coat polysaccharide biosynthesis protein SpsF
MKILATIEARMSSSRLPGKVMMNLNKKPMIGFLVDRLKKSQLIDQIAVATSLNHKDDKLVKYLVKEKINFYRGSENNVLSRIKNTCKKFRAEIIVQLTADNPLVDVEIIDYMINFFLKKRKKKIDFLSNSGLGNFKKRQVPFGFDVQIFRFKDLLKISNKKKLSPLHKEHPSLYFYKEGKNEFNIRNINLPETWRSKIIYRLTVDEKEDYTLISKIISHFIKRRISNWGIVEICKFLNKNKKLININKNIVQKNLNILKNEN